MLITTHFPYHRFIRQQMKNQMGDSFQLKRSKRNLFQTCMGLQFSPQKICYNFINYTHLQNQYL